MIIDRICQTTLKLSCKDQALTTRNMYVFAIDVPRDTATALVGNDGIVGAHHGAALVHPPPPRLFHLQVGAADSSGHPEAGITPLPCSILQYSTLFSSKERHPFPQLLLFEEPSVSLPWTNPNIWLRTYTILCTRS